MLVDSLLQLRRDLGERHEDTPIWDRLDEPEQRGLSGAGSAATVGDITVNRRRVRRL